MKIAVIETGTAIPNLREKFGTYPEMLITLVSGLMPSTTFAEISVVSGDPLPEPGDYDGYVLMGSRHSVYEDLPWISPLKNLVRECSNKAIPQFCICFGHQIMAEALGGRVDAAPSGWVVGLQHYNVISGHFGAGKYSVAGIAYHQDQVTKLPAGAQIILASDTCEYAGILYQNGRSFSVQWHPEFNVQFTRELILQTAGDPLDKDVAEQALQSLSAEPDRDQLARAIRSALVGDESEKIVAQLLGQ